jgi:Ca-activated chloride channel family protein
MKGKNMTPELSVLPVMRLFDDLNSPLPLEHTAVEARITGLAAEVTISQRFRNPLTGKTDLEYLFPLPHDSAVTAFELRAGERVIRASVQEIEQARQQYQEARRLGQRAGLLEGRRPNLFALQLANIQPGEFILAVISYQQRIELLDGCCEFVFPMGTTPKYHRPGDEQEAGKVDAPVARDLAQVGDVAISLEVEPGFRCGEPTSPSHPLLVSHLSASRFQVKLDGAHLPNRDFVLRWRLEDQAIQFPAWQTPGEQGYFLATFMPPAPDAAAAPLPREYIFVLDRSGSMGGEPIQQAVNALRACLRTLNPQDTFAILLFDDRLEWLCSATAVTQAAVEQTDKLLGLVTGRGGTEILPALKTALSLSADPQRARVVVFLTDGAISAEEETLRQARALMGAARLFTFGVGPSVNRAFLQQLARIGRGEATFIGLDEDIEEAILRFQDRIAFPLLTNLNLRAEGCQLWDVYPARLPDLYAGRPLEVVGRFIKKGEAGLPASLVASGERAGTALEMRSALADSAAGQAALARLWARARVDDLIEQSQLRLKPEHETRAEIIALAIEAGLLTKYTAFLAIDSDSSATPGASHFVRVAHPLPEGLEMDGLISPQAAPRMLFQSAPVMPSPAAAKSFSVNEPADNRSIYIDKSDHAAPDLMVEKPIDAAEILRELARSQQLDGSWKNDVELTSAALLAFVRSGHTPQKGFYRKQVQRIFDWLAQTSAGGFAGFLRALALRELADATKNQDHIAAAQQALTGLPEPSGRLQKTALEILTAEPGPKITAQPHKLARSLDELRLVVVTRAPCSHVAPDLLKDDLGRALAAGMVAV